MKLCYIKTRILQMFMLLCDAGLAKKMQSQEFPFLNKQSQINLTI